MGDQGCGDLSFGTVSVDLANPITVHVPLVHDPDDAAAAQDCVDRMLRARGRRPVYEFAMCEEGCRLLVAADA